MLDTGFDVRSKLFDGIRRKLLDTGTRNRLIHLNREKLPANAISILDAQVDDLFDLLKLQGSKVYILATGKDRKKVDAESGEQIDITHMGDDAEDVRQRPSGEFIKTALGPEAQKTRLRKLYEHAKLAESEQGINVLYLAMGFLRWRESPSSDVWREAPLVLLPVDLVRNDRTSSFDLRAREDDLSTNLSLKERLSQDFGVILPEIEDDENWIVSDYLARVKDAISPQEGWAVDETGTVLGLFSFAKAVMIKDLTPPNWLLANELVDGILSSGFEPHAPIFPDGAKLDEHLDPADLVHVVDADGSQALVIEEVRRGTNMVVQGPPGTGKSQTITNIIASAVNDGKTVLFVAEKMAALTVVHDRLVKCGLQDICLELHSRSANKKALAQELGRTIQASIDALPATNEIEPLRLSRDRLNKIVWLLHSPLDTGDTPYETLSEIIGFIGKNAPAPVLRLRGLEKLKKQERAKIIEAIERLAVAHSVVGPHKEHPLWGVTNYNLQPTDISRLPGQLSEAAAALRQLMRDVERLSTSLEFGSAASVQDMARIRDLLKIIDAAPDDGASSINETIFDHVGKRRFNEALLAGGEWKRAREAVQGQFSDRAWKDVADLMAIRQALLAGQNSFFRRLLGPYRKASAELETLLAGPLPSQARERLELVDKLSAVQTTFRKVEPDLDYLRMALSEVWRKEFTDFEATLEAVQWLSLMKEKGYTDLRVIRSILGSVENASGDAADLDAALAKVDQHVREVLDHLRYNLTLVGNGTSIDDANCLKLADALDAIAANLKAYEEWARFGWAWDDLQSMEAGDILPSILDGRVPAARGVEEFSYACAEARWKRAIESQEVLGKLSGIDRHKIVADFQHREVAQLKATQTEVLRKHYAQVPTGSMGEMKIIRGEVARKTRHMPVRKLMAAAGGMIQRIKPVMLMSPISVAQFLPPGSVQFDLLVIDEASQVKPEDAIGVIGRARQIVVVGDQKQLPPTSFFDRLTEGDSDGDEDEVVEGAGVSEMESILTLCEARGLPARMLSWHYRSRDPSLIRVSNAEFYKNLILPPSPFEGNEFYGLQFRRVPGVYARGGSGLGRPSTNRIEAEHLVRAVAEHAETSPGVSLGIATFSTRQADMITELLELERRRNPVLDSFLREGKNEDLFVKSIENIQGDERDVIFISVGFGPSEPNGRLSSMSFGPVNNEGGERRLNVLFTRSRIRCVVFASFDPGDIDLGRTQKEGPRVLKRFLEYARSGVMEESAVTGRGADSPFEEDVARVIEGLGYKADLQVGSAGFLIDIGVRHPDRPGRHILAVECDGAAYHSSLWARERDRLRQSVLENLGWTFHRIWSTDWFHRRQYEVRRLKEALEKARDADLASASLMGANSKAPTAPKVARVVNSTPVDLDDVELRAPDYVRMDEQLHSKATSSAIDEVTLNRLVKKVIDVEGPIHLKEIGRRVAGVYGRTRTDKLLTDRIEYRVRQLESAGDVRRTGDFVMTPQQAANPPVRNRSKEKGHVTKAEFIAPIEIAAALRMVKAACGDMTEEELVRATSRLLGFRVRKLELNEAIMAVIASQSRC